MELKPTIPPGRKTRKARAFATEIQRLAGIGYSMNAIREALQSAGITVSKTTVLREVHRKRQGSQPHAIAVPALPASRISVCAEPPTTAPAAPTAHPSPSQCSGQATAEAFFTANPAKPRL